MPKYDSRYQKIEDIKAKALRDANGVPSFRTIGMTRYPISEAEVTATKKQIREAAQQAIQAEISFIESDLQAERRKAVQGVFASEPRATEQDRAEAGELVRAFNSSKALLSEKTSDFHRQLEFHVSNGTNRSLPYILANRELNPTDSTDYLVQIAPDLATARQALSDIEQDAKEFDVFNLHQQASDPASLSLSERIRIKQNLFELGVPNPNF